MSSHQDKPRIFIGSSGNGLPVASAIQAKLMPHAWPKIWNEGVFKLSYGTLESLLKAVEEHDFGVFVFTGDDFVISKDVNYDGVRDNVLFECGLWMGRVGRERTLVVRDDRPGLKIPSDLLGITFATFDGSCPPDELQTAIGPACQQLIERIKTLPKKEGAAKQDDELAAYGKRIIERAKDLRSHPEFVNNRLLQMIVKKSLQQVSSRLQRIPLGYNVSASHYPDYLTALQDSELDPVVKAVAIVDQEERFWQLEPGLKILRTSNPKSQRVFVFTKHEDLSRNIYTLLEHDQKYNIRVMSADKLKEFQPFNKDFSVIMSGDSKLVAYYDGRQSLKTISFSAEKDVVHKHERTFDAIYWAGVSMKEIFAAAEINGLSDNAELKAQEMARLQTAAEQVVFGQALRQLERRPVEMSDYISVDDYDEHEEEHAYFQPMMERMIEIFEMNRGKLPRHCRVLEFGAGTGIFTRRLARLPDVSVTAMEIDWACFRKLQNNIKRYKLGNVSALNKDSRRYDPEGEEGKFDFIFSSFADHHIRDNVDKAKYLDNVKQNLKPGGLFIVGDEFLPHHERKDPEDRARALHTYHQHIINEAQKNGHEILIMLETEALQSGLNERGDFKLSCKQYEKIMSDAGFVLVYRPEKIGPPDRDDIGGVYVYTWSARD